MSQYDTPQYDRNVSKLSHGFNVLIKHMQFRIKNKFDKSSQSSHLRQ